MHISQWIPLPTQSCLALYSFLHSPIMWLMVSSMSSHSLHLLFCCVLSILALIWLVLMALFCAAIRRDSVALLKSLFLSHIQVLSCEMLFISRLKRHWSCFSSHFCFIVFVILLSIVLSVLFLMAVISPPTCFFYAVFESMYGCHRCIRCWQVLFFPLFMVHIVFLRRFWDVKPCAWSLLFLFFGPFV